MAVLRSLEQVWRARFRSAPVTDATSSPTQFGGRTTLNSGSPTVVVSTFAVQSDSMILAFEEGNVNYGILFGQFTIASENTGSTSLFGTVSNAAITASSQIFLQPKITRQSSGMGTAIMVASQGAGSFDATFATLVTPHTNSTLVNYFVSPMDGIPSPIEVKSISHGNFFTLGRADGRGVARNTTVLWHIISQ